MNEIKGQKILISTMISRVKDATNKKKINRKTPITRTAIF